MISTMQFLGLFYKFSPKRQSKLDISISLKNPGNNVLKSKDNVEHTSIEERYRSSIFLPFLDSVLQQLNNRFQSKTKDAIKGMHLIPNNKEKLTSEKEKNKGVLCN